MLNYPAATATSAVTSFRVPALPMGVCVEGRLESVGTAMSATIHTPAFLKGAVSGVRAWSPPL
jgi:hypothetical protein